VHAHDLVPVPNLCIGCSYRNFPFFYAGAGKGWSGGLPLLPCGPCIQTTNGRRNCPIAVNTLLTGARIGANSFLLLVFLKRSAPFKRIEMKKARTASDDQRPSRKLKAVNLPTAPVGAGTALPSRVRARRWRHTVRDRIIWQYFPSSHSPD